VIVVDSNIWVSAALLPRSVPAQALQHIIASEQLAVSPQQISEIQAVLERPKFRARIDAAAVARVTALLRAAPWHIEPTEAVFECRDPKDNMVLEIALAADARLIVSGDDDLLALDPWRGRRILTPRAYLKLVSG